MNELVSLLALELTSRKKIAENADVALKYKLRPRKYLPYWRTASTKHKG